MQITAEPTVNGYRLFNGPFLVATVNTLHDKGLRRDGAVIYEPLPRESWTVHLCAPSLSVADLQTIAASIPETAAP
jgi:hypothetical protein